MPRCPPRKDVPFAVDVRGFETNIRNEPRYSLFEIVSKERCQSYFISRRSPHLGISKDSESCASAHRCLHYAYARLIARVTFQLITV